MVIDRNVGAKLVLAPLEGSWRMDLKPRWAAGHQHEFIERYLSADATGESCNNINRSFSYRQVRNLIEIQNPRRSLSNLATTFTQQFSSNAPPKTASVPRQPTSNSTCGDQNSVGNRQAKRTVFKCKTCSTKTLYRNDMKNHIMRELGYKPYK